LDHRPTCSDRPVCIRTSFESPRSGPRVLAASSAGRICFAAAFGSPCSDLRVWIRVWAAFGSACSGLFGGPCSGSARADCARRRSPVQVSTFGACNGRSEYVGDRNALQVTAEIRATYPHILIGPRAFGPHSHPRARIRALWRRPAPGSFASGSDLRGWIRELGQGSAPDVLAFRPRADRRARIERANLCAGGVRFETCLRSGRARIGAFGSSARICARAAFGSACFACFVVGGLHVGSGSRVRLLRLRITSSSSRQCRFLGLVLATAGQNARAFGQHVWCSVFDVLRRASQSVVRTIVKPPR